MIGIDDLLLSGASGLASGLSSGGLSVLSSALGNSAAKSAARDQFGYNWLLQQEAQKYNAQQSALAFQRSLEADSTKYSRAVADLKNAGINPMLVSGGVSASGVSSPSATSPSGSVSQRQTFQPDLSGAVESAFDFALRADRQSAEMAKLDAATRKENFSAERERVALAKERAELDPHVKNAKNLAIKASQEYEAMTGVHDMDVDRPQDLPSAKMWDNAVNSLRNNSELKRYLNSKERQLLMDSIKAGKDVSSAVSAFRFR